MRPFALFSLNPFISPTFRFVVFHAIVIDSQDGFLEPRIREEMPWMARNDYEPKLKILSYRGTVKSKQLISQNISLMNSCWMAWPFQTNYTQSISFKSYWTFQWVLEGGAVRIDFHMTSLLPLHVLNEGLWERYYQ